MRVAVIGDLLEEGWPSMDLVADMLSAELARGHGREVSADLVRPALRRHLSRAGEDRGHRFNADRGINRLWHYPRHLGRLRHRFDRFHVVDHSYAHLVHALPAGRTVVTCHDLDTFRCLLEPRSERRSLAFRWMTRRILAGLGRAARVTCDTAAIRDELVARELVEPARVRVVPNGVDALCSPRPDPEADAAAATLLGEPAAGSVELLHVGSTAPRKRLDVLVEVMARLRPSLPGAHLLRVGGALPPELERRARTLGVAEAIRTLPELGRPVLAAVYRRAALVLQPSEREGFGLPVLEAMASGTPVLASDLPVLREVGGTAAAYLPVGDVDAWAREIGELLAERAHRPEDWRRRRDECLARAALFSWERYAQRMVEIYRELEGG